MTIGATRTKAAELRERIGHPIVDGDGHTMEFLPTLDTYLREELGATSFERFHRQYQEHPKPRTLAQRRDNRERQGAWLAFASASQVDDMAASFLPKLLAHRLDEIGLDFTVLYGTNTSRLARIEDEEIRIGACRAVNRFWADHYLEHADRMTPAALIPMHTPQEAIAEAEHAKRLGLKVLMLQPGVRRPIPALHRKYPELFPAVHWWDTFGLDSEYDYDPLWARCQELGFAATFHSGGGVGNQTMSSTSVSSYVFNHVGSHAYAMHHLAKSLFLGGVTRRFPKLTFAFLECGVSWAGQLLMDLEEHWEGRNATVMAARESQLDLARWRALRDEWGGALTAGSNDDSWLQELAENWPDTAPEERDEFRHAAIEDEDDIRDRFVDSFYFGCEAGDRLVTTAFSPANAFGAELKPILSSDIGHWDVNNMEEVLPESYRLVEKGLLTPEQYRKFTLENPSLVHLRMNPDFFKGTRVESEAARLLAAGTAK